tara:strand:+ start:7762 stop:8502 length:741 start_codon:yes stop_codon:yes gene_type:complete
MKDRIEMQAFREGIRDIVKNYKYIPKDYSIFEKFPLNNKQCLYVAHWADKGMIYEKNLESLTGYTLAEFNAEDLVAYTHPDDRDIVKKITKGVVEHVIKIPTSNEEAHLFLSFRFLKKDGNYCKILRQSSAFERDVKGRMVSNFSLLTDISFLETSDRVEWNFQANELDLKKFKKVVYQLYKDFYTKREKEVIRMLDKDFTSEQIAQNLHISKHTVQTHRKNILKKAKSHSIDDVLLFCKKNGILE